MVEGGGRSGCLVFRREAGVSCGDGDGVSLGLRQGDDLERGLGGDGECGCLGGDEVQVGAGRALT